ncbi:MULTISPECIES: hypothetical protein [unclassified Micromonospora]|uniref:hypothetical protein n=1 Tax=unclassified Micromonospora TaxID=2617518 RepID=UPI002FF1A70E
MSLSLHMGAQPVLATADLIWAPVSALPRLDAVSILRPGNEEFHYSDGSHRWIPPDPDDDQEVWDEQVRQHKQGHLRNECPEVRVQRLV